MRKAGLRDALSLPVFRRRQLPICDLPVVGARADWRIMRLDGSNGHRLIYMNKRGNVRSVGTCRPPGSLTSVIPALGDVMTKSLGHCGKIFDVAIHAGCIDR
jgi:hypothetical protein